MLFVCFYLCYNAIKGESRNMKIKNKQTGAIKVRIFAICLLIISCSLFMSSYRSIKRKFDGWIVYKSATGQMFTTSYDLYICPEKIQESNIIAGILNSASGKIPVNDNYRIVGVSSMVYENAEYLTRIKKTKYSPLIWVNDVMFFDKGLFWFIWALIFTVVSIIMYIQTSKHKDNKLENDEEEI